MQIKVTQCSMCIHYNTEQYCEVWEQYITNDAFYCACGVKAGRKIEPIIEVYNGNADKENWQCITIKSVEDKPQTVIESE